MIWHSLSQTVVKGSSRILMVLLVVLYVIGSSNFDLLHSMAHDHEIKVAHNAEQEKNPCHRLTYHNDVEHGCKHDFHLSNSDKCVMCDIVHHGDQEIEFGLIKKNKQIYSEYFAFYKQSLDSYWAVISSSRAPPVFA